MKKVLRRNEYKPWMFKIPKSKKKHELTSTKDKAKTRKNTSCCTPIYIGAVRRTTNKYFQISAYHKLTNSLAITLRLFRMTSAHANSPEYGSEMLAEPKILSD